MAGASAPTPTPPAAPPSGGSGTRSSSPSRFVTVHGENPGFGSIIVNGTRYETDIAEVKNDDEAANMLDLAIGQIVALRADKNGDDELPTALRVRYEKVMEGPISAIASDLTNVTNLGVTVILTDQTIFEDRLDPATLTINDVLEISGRYGANGNLIAS